MNEDELRRTLRATVPEPPPTSGWASAARDRSRRARAMVAGVVLLATGLGGAALLTGLPRSGTTAIPAAPVSTAGIGSNTPVTPSAADPCDRTMAVPPGPAHLPGGVAEVRLCPDGEDPEATFVTPSDHLTSGVAALVDAINAEPAAALPETCSTQYARSFRVVFGYADGTAITLIGRLASADRLGYRKPGPCDGLGGPATWRSGTLLERLRTAWLEQRAAQPLEAPYQDGNCAAESPGLFVVDLKELSAAVLCVPGDAGRRPALSRDQVRELVADMAHQKAPTANDDQDFSTVLNLYTPWGDVVTHFRADALRWPTLHGEKASTWTPSPAIRAWLEPMIAQAPTESTSPVPSAEPCSGQPSLGDIPTGALSLRLCPTGDIIAQQPVPGVSLGPEAAARVLAVLARQPRFIAGSACRADLGPSYLLTAEFSGREPVVMSLELYGCELAGTATDRRTGAAEVVDAFLAESGGRR